MTDGSNASYITSKIDQIAESLITIRVDQGRLSQSVEQLVIETTAKSKTISEHDSRITKLEGTIGEHSSKIAPIPSIDTRITKIEGVVKILQWFGGIGAGVIGALVIKILGFGG